MQPSTILLSEERTEGGLIATITLNRPEVRNAINRAMIDDLGRALDQLVAEPALRAIVFTGAGGKAFAAGADISELKTRGVAEALQRINAALFRRVEEIAVPTIAAIDGFALGGGCELAMACDIRIAGRSSKLGQPEVALGIIPGAGAIQRLPRLVGFGRAKELIFTGRILDAAEAERIGLINKVVDDGKALEEAMAMAGKIAEQGALAVKIAKAALNANAGTSIPYDAVDALGQAVLFESGEKHERMAAFLDKKSKEKK
ncbi:MAG: enoyl-CoA hydratase-related protein [Myxococcota bacterium]